MHISLPFLILPSYFRLKIFSSLTLPISEMVQHIFNTLFWNKVTLSYLVPNKAASNYLTKGLYCGQYSTNPIRWEGQNFFFRPMKNSIKTNENQEFFTHIIHKMALFKFFSMVYFLTEWNNRNNNDQLDLRGNFSLHKLSYPSFQAISNNTNIFMYGQCWVF